MSNHEPYRNGYAGSPTVTKLVMKCLARWKYKKKLTTTDIAKRVRRPANITYNALARLEKAGLIKGDRSTKPIAWKAR